MTFFYNITLLYTNNILISRVGIVFAISLFAKFNPLLWSAMHYPKKFHATKYLLG